MSSQLVEGVKWRRESFGSVAYFPSKDSFLALDHEHTQALADLLDPVACRQPYTYQQRNLASLGVVKGPVPNESRSGSAMPGLIGNFASLPAASRPLLVNCFATAHCPLACAYCYADDLMMPYRAQPETDLPHRVIAMADSIDAMVAVVTGGEPLAKPTQSAELINKLATTKAVVVDSSGVGDLSALLPSIQETRAHLRISLDSAVPKINDAQRPVGRRFQAAEGVSSWVQATRSIRLAASEGVPLSVQSVLTTSTSNVSNLTTLRDLLVDLGVTKWVLHVVLMAGRARKHRSSPRSSSPGDQFLTALNNFIIDTVDQNYPLDVRVTNANHAPNSVLLIDSQGNLLTESKTGTGKTVLGRPGEKKPRLAQSCEKGLDLASHYSRYLNCDVLPTFHRLD